MVHAAFTLTVLEAFPRTCDLDPLALAESYIPESDLDHLFITYDPYLELCINSFTWTTNCLSNNHGLSSDLDWPSNLAVYDSDPESTNGDRALIIWGFHEIPIPTLT